LQVIVSQSVSQSAIDFQVISNPIKTMGDEEDRMGEPEEKAGHVDENSCGLDGNTGTEAKGPCKTFSLKKWNAVAMWSWDVDCDTCAICRVHVMDACPKCQGENKQDECVVVWGDCNHSFHNCCMSYWVQQNNRCPLCQQDWVVQRIGK